MKRQSEKNKKVYNRFLKEYGQLFCFYCHKDIFKTVPETHPYKSTVDHFIPLSNGGTNKKENLVLACNKCNQIKSDKFPDVKLMQRLRASS